MILSLKHCGLMGAKSYPLDDLSRELGCNCPENPRPLQRQVATLPRQMQPLHPTRHHKRYAISSPFSSFVVVPGGTMIYSYLSATMGSTRIARRGRFSRPRHVVGV